MEKTTPLTWAAVKAQFGGNFGQMNHFRAKFLPNLKLALAVYPNAKVEVDEAGKGLVLHPSRPPVAPRQAALAR